MRIDYLKASKTWGKLPRFIKTHQIFNSINKIEKPFPDIGLRNSLEQCRIPSSTPLYIGFSSSGINGLWDIATMSMRGVCSCMHWENKHSIHLIGSITDPFLGMVYITDNQKTPFGISIKYRSLVRLVRVAPTEYRLLIERVYKDTGNTKIYLCQNRDPSESATITVFKDFLATKVNSQYPVITYHANTWNFSIPSSTSSKKLTLQELSLSDCGLNYAETTDNFIKKYANQN